MDLNDVLEYLKIINFFVDYIIKENKSFGIRIYFLFNLREYKMFLIFFVDREWKENEFFRLIIIY